MGTGLTEPDFAYLEHVALSRMHAVREAAFFVRLDFDISAIAELIRHIGDLHEVLHETLTQRGALTTSIQQQHAHIGEALVRVRSLVEQRTERGRGAAQSGSHDPHAATAVQ